MSRQQQQVALLAVLVVVMAGVFVRALRPRAAAPKTVTAPAAAPPAAVIEPLPDRAGQREAQRAETLRLAWASDPFTHTAGTGSSGLVLSGILWDASAPMAIVNGQMLRVGEELDGYRVLTIGPSQVSLSDGMDTVSLTVSP